MSEHSSRSTRDQRIAEIEAEAAAEREQTGCQPLGLKTILRQKPTDQPVKTFSIGFAESSFNELDHARAHVGVQRRDDEVHVHARRDHLREHADSRDRHPDPQRRRRTVHDVRPGSREEPRGRPDRKPAFDHGRARVPIRPHEMEALIRSVRGNGATP